MTNPYMEVPKEDAATPPIKEIFYTRHTTYEITLNPNDTHQLYKTSDDRLESVVESFRKKLLQHLAPCASYTLVPEVSEPQVCHGDVSRPRVHFHGIMTLNHPCKFLTEHLHHLASYCSVAINNYRPDYWPEYIKKQKDVVAPCLGPRYYLTNKDTQTTAYGGPATKRL